MDPSPWDRRAHSVDGLGRELIVQERRQEGQGLAGATNKDQLRDFFWQWSLHVGALGKVLELFRTTVVPGPEVLV